MANLLGALGYSLIRISYLKFLRRLSIKGRVNFQDGFVATSAHLAHEYLRLGKTSRAGFVFAQAESKLASPGVSAHSRVIYQLLYAEYLAVLANHDRRSALRFSALVNSADLSYAVLKLMPKHYRSTRVSHRRIQPNLRRYESSNALSACKEVLSRLKFVRYCFNVEFVLPFPLIVLD